ncbi:MAG: HPr family phosphocarrier protein [Endomicrobia bacterium]|nr:HPr family phosphocarrier protein [Endomicrobiia bacterium]MCX7940338.1 HPr family phosphocarrier protein [Endomicrobiia bacterium]MDW8055231.1 HPr family phosphocarrier protein [Elusimicrobiota bacterium]
MIEIDLIVKRKFGIHLRPATEFVQNISKFKSSVKIMKDDQIADGKSVLDLVTLVLQENDQIKVIVEGEDENEVVKLVKNFFSFDEIEHEKRTDT